MVAYSIHLHSFTYVRDFKLTLTTSAHLPSNSPPYLHHAILARESKLDPLSSYSIAPLCTPPHIHQAIMDGKKVLRNATEGLNQATQNLLARNVESNLAVTIEHNHATIYADLTRGLAIRDNILPANSQQAELDPSTQSDAAEADADADDGETVALPEYEADDPIHLAGGGAVILNGQTVLVHKWLGDGYTERIVSPKSRPSMHGTSC